MTTSFDFDVDIDLADRALLLKHLKCTPASVENNGVYSRHNTGVYFQQIPVHPLEGFAAMEHKQAANQGFFKVDFLNNYAYRDVKTPAHLDQLVSQQPRWSLLEYPDIVETLYHINKHFDTVNIYKPSSVEQLAMVLALIRPAKKHLIGQDWDIVEQQVWLKPHDGSYHFKKAHAIAFAMVIVVQLNLLVNDAANQRGL